MERLKPVLVAAALAAVGAPESAAVVFDGAMLQYQQVNTLGGAGLQTDSGPDVFTVGPGIDIIDDALSSIASDFEGDTLTITNLGVPFFVSSGSQPFAVSLFYVDLLNQLPDLGDAALVASDGISSNATPVDQVLTDAVTVSPDVIGFRLDGLSWDTGGFVTYRLVGVPDPDPAPDPTPVPSPAAAPVLIAGMAMLWLLRRRRA